MRIKAQDLFDVEEEETEDFGSEKETITKEEVIEWLWKHQDPSDEDVHEWAESIDVDEEALEEIIYEIATDHVRHLKEDEEGEEGEEESGDDMEVSAQWYD